jgi:hypothetical protein
VNRNLVRRILTIAAVGIGSLVTLATSVPCAGQVWGIQPAINQIVRVDPATGAVSAGFTPPGGALVPGQLFGGLTMAEQGTVLLYQNPETNPTDLYRLNPITGGLLSTHFMPAAGNPDFRAGLSFQSGAGALGVDAIYAVNNGSPVQRQNGYDSPVLVNHTVGSVLYAGALGGDDNGRQFVAVIGGIQEFDPVVPNNPLNTLPLPAGAGDVGGLAFDGTWLYLSNIAGRLFTIDPDTGAVVNNVLVQGGPLIGLAARRIPEPNTMLLTAVGGLLLLCRMRRTPRANGENFE